MRTGLVERLADKINSAKQAQDKKLFDNIMMSMRFTLLDLEETKKLDELTNNLKWGE